MKKILYKFEAPEQKIVIEAYTKDDQAAVFIEKKVDDKVVENRSFGREAYGLHWFWDRVAEYVEQRHGELS